jgi:hypothetical protein
MNATELAELIDKDTASRLPSMADTRRDWTEQLKQLETDAYNQAIEDAAKTCRTKFDYRFPNDLQRLATEAVEKEILTLKRK